VSWEIITGDCLDWLREREAGSVDAVVTDPPYGTGAWKRQTSGAGSDPTAKLIREKWDVWTEDWIEQARRVARCAFGFFIPWSVRLKKPTGGGATVRLD